MSSASLTPSPSASLPPEPPFPSPPSPLPFPPPFCASEQPFRSTEAPASVFGQSSSVSGTPSLSPSLLPLPPPLFWASEQPHGSTSAPRAVPEQSSKKSSTPSQSSSGSSSDVVQLRPEVSSLFMPPIPPEVSTLEVNVMFSWTSERSEVAKHATPVSSSVVVVVIPKKLMEKVIFPSKETL